MMMDEPIRLADSEGPGDYGYTEILNQSACATTCTVVEA
jgi:hypothetical protein